MPPHPDYRYFTDGLDAADIISDDFDSGGAYSSGAASIPNGGIFGRCQWRCSLTNGAPTVSYVTTLQDKDHQGILDVNTGSNANGTAGAIRAPSGVPATVLGTNQTFVKRWSFLVPQVSDGSNGFIVRLGWLSAINATPADAVIIQASSGNILGIARKSGVQVPAAGGSGVPLMAGVWNQVLTIWNSVDGEMLFYANNNDGNGFVFIGSVASADLPIGVNLSEGFHIQKQNLGVVPRNFLLDRFWLSKQWSNPRGA